MIVLHNQHAKQSAIPILVIQTIISDMHTKRYKHKYSIYLHEGRHGVAWLRQTSVSEFPKQRITIYERAKEQNSREGDLRCSYGNGALLLTARFLSACPWSVRIWNNEDIQNWVKLIQHLKLP